MFASLQLKTFEISYELHQQRFELGDGPEFGESKKTRKNGSEETPFRPCLLQEG